MHKSNNFSHITRRLWHPAPLAYRLFVCGLCLLLCGMVDVLWRMHEDMTAGAWGYIFKYADGIECIFAGLALLTGGVLLLDTLERKNDHT